MIPPILTCLIGKRLGTESDRLASYSLRQTAASVLSSVSKKFSKSSQSLKPRLARTCLKAFLDPTKPLGSSYGGLIGLRAIGGPEIVRALIVPNLKEYESLIKEAVEAPEETKRTEGEMILDALMQALDVLEEDTVGTVSGMANGHAVELRKDMVDKVGDLLAEKVLDLGSSRLIKAILEC